VIIRDAKHADSEAIRELIAAAFGRPDEAVLIDRLRSDGACVISLVAVEGDVIVGHVLFSGVTAPFRALGLGPVSVKPNRQRRGIGSRLIRAGLDYAGEAGWVGVFVLGDPKFYSRFGFDPDLAAGFMCRFCGPHLMALALGRELPTREGVIEFASAFGSFG
jgi:putative acetyltransferase